MGVIRSARHQFALRLAALAGAGKSNGTMFCGALLLTPLAGLGAGTPPCWGRDKRVATRASRVFQVSARVRFAPGGARWGREEQRNHVLSRTVVNPPRRPGGRHSPPAGGETRRWWRRRASRLFWVSARVRFAPGGARWGREEHRSHVLWRTVVNPPRRPGGRHSPLLGERHEGGGGGAHRASSGCPRGSALRLAALAGGSLV